MLVSKLHSGTSKTKQLVPVHLDLPLFWKSHCATCPPTCVILYHVIRSCKGPITGFLSLDKIFQPTGQFREKLYPILDPNALIYIPYPRVNCLKTIPFTAAHTYIAHIWQYPPPREVNTIYRPPYWCPTEVHQHGGTIVGSVNLRGIFRRISQLWDNTRA